MIMSPFRITAQPGENILVYRKGSFACVLRPGDQRSLRWSERHVVVPMKQQSAELPLQEIGTADGLQVRVSAVTRWEVADPRAFHEVDADPESALYLATQIALRDLVASLEAPEAVQRLRAEPELVRQLVDAVQSQVEALGVRVLAVVIKDVQLPVEMRRAAIDLATAKVRGLAQLEEARARTASLRALANGARLLDEHPALAQLQLVQAAPMGSQLVLKLGTDERAE